MHVEKLPSSHRLFQIVLVCPNQKLRHFHTNQLQTVNCWPVGRHRHRIVHHSDIYAHVAGPARAGGRAWHGMHRSANEPGPAHPIKSTTIAMRSRCSLKRGGANARAPDVFFLACVCVGTPNEGGRGSATKGEPPPSRQNCCYHRNRIKQKRKRKRKQSTEV